MLKQFKFTPLSALKVSNDARGDVSGYRSIFFTIDEGGDIVIKNAFIETIPNFLKSGFTAHSHDWSFSESVGYPIESYETEVGWFVRSRFHGTPDAQAIRQKVKERLDDGLNVGFSFGYRIIESETIFPSEYKLKLPQYLKANNLKAMLDKAEQFPCIRILKKLAVKEDSIVTSPMNTLAGATGVNSTDAMASRMAIEMRKLKALLGLRGRNPQLGPAMRREIQKHNLLCASLSKAGARMKAGARNSAADVRRIKTIHNAARALDSSVCPGTRK